MVSDAPAPCKGLRRRTRRWLSGGIAIAATTNPGRQRRRTIVVTAVAVGAAAALITVASAESPADDGQHEIAIGSTWS